MGKFLSGLLIVLLIVVIGVMALAMIQQGQTAQTVAQTAQAQAEAFAWREYNQALQTLYSIMTLICGGLVVALIVGGLVAYRLMSRKPQQQMQGQWSPGPNARWGRVGGQSQRPMMPVQYPQQQLPPGYYYPPQHPVYLPVPQPQQRGYGQPLIPYNPYPQGYDPNEMVDGTYFDEE